MQIIRLTYWIKTIIKKIKKDVHFHELLRGGSVALFFKIMSVLGSYLFFFIAARYFDAKGVGIFTTCWTVMMISSVIGKLGFDSSVVRFISQAFSQKQSKKIHVIYLKSLLLVFTASFVVFIIIWITAPYLTNLLFEHINDTLFIRLTGLSVIFFSVTRLNAESLRGIRHITEFSLFNNGAIYFLSLLFVIVLTNLNDSYLLLIMVLNSAVFLLMIVSFFRVWQNKILRCRDLRSYFGDFAFRKALYISIPMMLTNSLFLIMNWTDIMMLSFFKNETLVGIYNIALKIAALNTVTLVAINSIAAPKFVEIRESYSYEAFRRFIWQTSFINILVTMPVFLLIVIFPEFLLTIFGKGFTDGSATLIILAVGQFFSALSGSTIPVLNMTGKERIARNIILTGAVINGILNFLFIPKYGIEGAAFSTACSTILWNLFAVIYIYKQYGFLIFPIQPLLQKLKI